MADPKAAALASKGRVSGRASARPTLHWPHPRSDQMVVQNAGGTLIRHEIVNLVAGKHGLLKPGTNVKIEYTDRFWTVITGPGPSMVEGR